MFAMLLAAALAEAPKVQEGKPAPDITLEASLPGGKTKTMPLRGLKGKNVVT